MKKRYLLIAGLISITPGLATPANIEFLAKYPSQHPVVTLAGVPVHESRQLADFATLEPLESSASASLASDHNPADRLRLIAWLLGPSIIAMVTIARRRDTQNKPG